MELTRTSLSHPAPRHPLDPDPVRASKARAVFALGLTAMLTGAFIGGLVPATAALLLARQVRREAYASGGYLTGAALCRRGERLAWTGIVLAATAVVLGAVFGVVDFVNDPIGRDFDSTVD